MFLVLALAGCTSGSTSGSAWQATRWPSYAELFDAAAPSVVNVQVEQPAAVGSGFAVSAHEVITARHLVLDAGGIYVRGIGGWSLPARVVGEDARTDLALLRVDDAELPEVRLGRVASARVGDTVVAIGNPYGFGHSLSVGTIGSLGRRLAPDAGGPEVDFLQLSMPLHPGNSGGPLFAESGSVVGILSGTHAEGPGIAFAVPVDALVEVLEPLRQGRRAGGAFLGAFTRKTARGLVVHTVVPSSPADYADMKAGDVIVAFAGAEVGSPAALGAVLRERQRGEQAEIVVVRGEARRTLTVTLSDWARQAVVVSGMTLRPSAGSGGRVVSIEPDSPAAKAGVRVGDVVSAVDGVPMYAPVDVQERLSAGQPAELGLSRAGQTLRLRLSGSG